MWSNNANTVSVIAYLELNKNSVIGLSVIFKLFILVIVLFLYVAYYLKMNTNPLYSYDFLVFLCTLVYSNIAVLI